MRKQLRGAIRKREALRTTDHQTKICMRADTSCSFDEDAHGTPRSAAGGASSGKHYGACGLCYGSRRIRPGCTLYTLEGGPVDGRRRPGEGPADGKDAVARGERR